MDSFDKKEDFICLPPGSKSSPYLVWTSQI